MIHGTYFENARKLGLREGKSGPLSSGLCLQSNKQMPCLTSFHRTGLNLLLKMNFQPLPEFEPIFPSSILPSSLGIKYTVTKPELKSNPSLLFVP